MAYATILFPLFTAVLAAVPGRRPWRPWLLPVTGLGQTALVCALLARPELATTSAWLALDAPGRLVLLLICVLFTLTGFYAAGYLRYRQERPNHIFCACLLAFLAMMTLVTWSQHLGLMWVGIEATTLCTAPLIYFNHTTRSIEATWKYLLIGSVGIALALLGSFFLAYAALHGGAGSSLTFANLLQAAPLLSKPWLRAAFVLLVVGYGTKMGLAPMHTWKPDAYGEAPGMVGALLAGGLTNCAFLAILRVYHICQAAGDGTHCSRILVALGLFSMATAGVFMLGQKDFKRMLAYSSVEHMGILVLGVGIGGGAAFGTMLHMVNNGITKTVLFLSAGNIHRAYGGKTTDSVRGALRRLPLSGALFLGSFLAIAGSPPFAPFVSVFAILDAAFGGGRYVVAGLFLALLMLVFIGMGATVLNVVLGEPSSAEGESDYRESWLTGLPPLLLMGAVLVFGLWLPTPLRGLLADAASFLEVTP